MKPLLDNEISSTKKDCEIWAIGGGKGGTGKSFITSSIGTYLALKGKRVILIDADLGGANLHSFLGINRPKSSLTEFFDNRVSLNNLIVGTGLADMGLITGDVHSLDSDNIKYAQKLKFFRQIRGLDTDYILIDLGAGSHNNTLDTFLLADKMVVVIVPEITAIENMYQFLKNALFRKLKMTLGVHGLKDIVQDAWKNRGAYGIMNLKELIDYLKGASAHIRDILNRELSTFRIFLVLNQIRNSQDIAIGTSVKSICSKYFGFQAYYIGYVEHDDCIWNSINRKQSFMRMYSSTRCAREIEKLAENLLEKRELRVTKG
jgi:flagellar biosynthesis protein FlhG